MLEEEVMGSDSLTALHAQFAAGGQAHHGGARFQITQANTYNFHTAFGHLEMHQITLQ